MLRVMWKLRARGSQSETPEGTGGHCKLPATIRFQTDNEEQHAILDVDSKFIMGSLVIT